MGWEKRGSKFYYYHKKRRGRQVTSVYLGNNISARLLAELDDQERENQLQAQIRLKQQISEMKILDADQENLTGVVRNLVRAVLLAAGYHPHKGQWRKRRHD